MTPSQSHLYKRSISTLRSFFGCCWTSFFCEFITFSRRVYIISVLRVYPIISVLHHALSHPPVTTNHAVTNCLLMFVQIKTCRLQTWIWKTKKITHACIFFSTSIKVLFMEEITLIEMFQICKRSIYTYKKVYSKDCTISIKTFTNKIYVLKCQICGLQN